MEPQGRQTLSVWPQGCNLRAMSRIGERLRRVREARGISQDALGRQLGRNQRWISQRETGQVRTSVEEAEAIAAALGYSADLAIAPAGSMDRLLDAAAEASPEDIERAADLLEALPRVSPTVRQMVLGMLASAHASAREAGAR